MTTFTFNLARNASPEDIERVHCELSNRFPQHRFIGESYSDIEFNILMVDTPPVSRIGTVRPTDPAEVDLVKHAFFSMIDGWG